MKNYPAFLFLIMSFLYASCNKDNINTDYDRSYNSWLSFKNSSNNSYTYTVYHSSIFGGYAETVLVIKNGQIVSRNYTDGSFKPNTDSLIIRNTWAEGANSLNTHGNQGDQLLTLDDIYTKAKTDWLKVDKKQNDIYFETRNNGLLSMAGYVPKGCQDDCFVGVSIKKINPM